MSKNETHFIKFLILMLGLGLMSSLSACSNHHSDLYRGTPEVQILGGQPVKASSIFSKKVIYLAIGVEWSKGQNGFSVAQTSQCTSSAISPRILLTAAHCVKDFKPEQINAVLSLNPWNHDLNLKEWIKVEKVKIHEGYLGTSNNFLNDVALLYLSEDLPQAHITALASPALVGSDVELISIGYGMTSLYERSAADTKATPSLLNYVQKSVADFKSDKMYFEVDQSDGKGICSGDSGGPGLIYDRHLKEFFILGVASYVYGEASGASNESPVWPAQTECLGRAGYTNVLTHLEWIEKSAIELQR